MLSIARPLVSTAWLAKTLAAATAGASLRLLDVTWSAAGKSGLDIYQEGHIPGSHFFDLRECRDKESPFLFTIPPPEIFSEYVGKGLGISNNTEVIIYDSDPVFKVKTSGRVWWMFRLFGHDKVSVLDGGLEQWTKDGFSVTTEASKPPEPAIFKAKKRPELLKTFGDIMEHQKQAKFQLLDSRPYSWFDGTNPSPIPGLPTGSIKTSLHLPFPDLFQEGSSKFKSPEEIKATFESKGIDLSHPITTTCYLGVTANMLTLAAFVAGKEDVAVYDGSWNEFSQKAPRDAMNITVYDKEE